MQDEDVENLVERCLLNPEAHSRLSELLLNARRAMVREWFMDIFHAAIVKRKPPMGWSIIMDTVNYLDEVLTW